MAPLRQQDEFQAQEEVALYSSLCLLDAQTGDGAKQIDFSKGMFKKPNAKALEFILYHAYSVIKGKASAKKYFKGLWPLLDKDRKQSKEFYQKAQDWLKEAGQLDAHGHSLAPFQRNPSGPKVVSFLCDLTDWALRVQHERLFPDDVVAHSDVQDAQLLLALSEPLITAARAQNQIQAQRLLSVCQQGSQVQQQAERSAAQLRDLYYSLTAQLKEARASSDATLSPEGLFSLLEGKATQGISSKPVLPPELQEQQQELQQLWAQLEQHVQEFAGLSGLVNALSGCDVHPHAIDGVELRQCGQLPGAPSTAGLDIAAMMEAWLVDVGAVCRYIKYLAGQPEVDQAGAEQQRTWGSAGGNSVGGARGSSVTPLVATSDASSHAPHLYAQLGLHKNCLDHMRGMKTALGAQMAAIAERIQQLESEVYSLIALEQQRCLAAMAPPALAAGADDAFQFEPVQQVAAAPSLGALFGEAGRAAGGTASLFNNSKLQLVPPTPMLQQLVQKQRSSNQQQQQQAAAAAATASGPISSAEPDGDEYAGRLSFGGAAGLCERASSPPVPPAASGLVESPHLQRGADSGADSDDDAGSTASSVSSAALPAAALLMSQELMDLDLVGSSDEDDGGLFAPASPARYGRNSDPLRLSLVTLAIRDEAAEAQAAAAAGEMPAASAAAGEAEPEQGGTERPSSGSSSSGALSFSLSAVRRPLGGGSPCEHGDDTPPQVGEAAHSSRQRSSLPLMGADSGEAAKETDTACDAEAERADGPSTVASTGPAAAGVAAAGAGEAAAGGSDDSTPVVCEPGLALADAMVPMSLPSGSDCMSSARPRRLTFAAAVSADSCGSREYSVGQVLSPGSSDGSSEAAGEWESAAPVQQPQQQGQSLSLLRQRFASVMEH